MATDSHSLPLPSHIHYELLLQLLERQTAKGIHQNPAHSSSHREQVQELIGTLRKAFSQQKQLEESCRRSRIPMEYHWSLNEVYTKKCIASETTV